MLWSDRGGIRDAAQVVGAEPREEPDDVEPLLRTMIAPKQPKPSQLDT